MRQRLCTVPLLFPARRHALRLHDAYRIMEQLRPPAGAVLRPRKSGQPSLVRLDRIRFLPRPLK